LFISRGAILAMFSSFLALTAPVQSDGAAGPFAVHALKKRGLRRSRCRPTTGATISMLESISLGSMSIWMNFFDPGSPQLLPLPCDSSQLRRRADQHHDIGVLQHRRARSTPRIAG